jgi:hypothetical protein
MRGPQRTSPEFRHGERVAPPALPIVPLQARAPAPSALGLVALGCIALALGLLVYAADRDPARALLLPAVAALHVGPIFGAVGSWLPSFVHPFAFSLFSAAALSGSARAGYGACAAWWAVNVGFEFAQHARFSGAIARALQTTFGDATVADALANYALRGRFDPADLAAATAGSLAAAAVLARPHRARSGHGS